MASHSLNCAVIGAGIAGLSACIALRRAGHNVELLEKSHFKNEIGAALTTTPNGGNVLDRWGFDGKKAGQTIKLQSRRFNPESLEQIGYLNLDGVEQRFGRGIVSMHRVDFHSSLREMALATDLPGSATLRLGTEVLDIDCKTGTLVLKDGTKLQKDLIVVADGIKSRFIATVNGVDVPRTYTGQSLYRAIIKMDTLLADDLVRPLWQGQRSGYCAAMNAKGVLFFTYECRLNKWLNVAIIGQQSANGDDWNAPISMDDVLSVLEDGFNPAWSAVAKCAGPDEWKGFPISSRDPLDRIYKDKVVLVGDAGHAMLPTHGQGATMALEDAAALEVLFSNLQSSDDVVKRLETFQQLRLPRSATTQLLSNAMLYFKDGGEVKERINQYYVGELPFGEDMWSENIRSFFYDYDIWTEAEKALGFVDHPNGIPNGTLKYFGTMKERTAAAS